MKLVKRLTMLFFTIWLIVSPVIGATAARVPRLDTTDVMDDLQGLKLGDVEFDEANYPLEDWTLEGGCKQYVLGVYEYGWGSDLYSLYIYVYNPDGGNVNHKYKDVYIGTLWTHADSVDNQRRSFEIHPEIVDQSEDGRFLKLKVDGSVAAKALEGASKRIYSVGLVTWYTQQSSYAGPDGLYYDITLEANTGGYGAFYTFNSNGTATYQSGETIPLKVNSSVYKTDFSPKGDYWHQMIYTVYFTIPKEYKESYDAICGIEATWEEYHTAPLVVTEDDYLLGILTKMAADSALDDLFYRGQVDYNYGSLITNYKYAPHVTPSGYISSAIVSGDKSLNLYSIYDKHRTDIFESASLFDPDPKLDFTNDIFRQFDTALKVEDIEKFYIPTVGRYYDTDGDGKGDIPATFINSVDSGKLLGKNTYTFTTEDILDVNNRFSSDWDKFWSGRFFDGEDVSVELAPFDYLEDSDMAGYSRSTENKSLFIGKEFWSEFYDTYQAKKDGDQVVLFRFALRDYYSAPARYVDNDNYDYRSNVSNCAVSYGTAFLDFDIIKLSFCKGSEVYEFKVDADPIDIVPGGYNPNSPGSGIERAASDIWEKLTELFQTIAKFIGGALVVIVVVIVLKWFLNWLALRRR